MMRFFKIFLSVLFVIAVSFFVVRSCVKPSFQKFYDFSAYKLYEPKPGTVKPKTPAISPASPKKIFSQAPEEAAPRMAIILDDWGTNYSLLKKAIALERPITLAILPNLEHSARIAKEARGHGLCVMLHMPMQPINQYQPLEPQTIMTTTPEKEIIRYLDEALSSFPHIEGVNNHMGSAATSDLRVMRIVMKHLNKKKLFFIDSNVVNTTQGAIAAREAGLPFARRDVFIDNELKPEAIKRQLNQAIKIALARGEVVVIGHDKKATLQAISEMIPLIEKAGVKLVYARDVVAKTK